MRYEQTQRRNPHQLTTKQHVFPAASIERFAQKDGFVSVFLHKQRKTVPCRPLDVLFCAKRAWNDASEHGFMKKVEDAFQILANQILDGTVSCSLGLKEHKIVSHFYALCTLRAEARAAPPQDVQMKGVLPGSTLTKNQEEILEKNGYIFARGTTMPGRHMTSIRIQVLLDRLCAPETTWAVVYSRVIEFVVPDSFFEVGIVPLSPNCCLVANQGGGEISSDNAIAINRIAIEKSSMYYFARDFSKCGV
jgi:hypothetical protein